MLQKNGGKFDIKLLICTFFLQRESLLVWSKEVKLHRIPFKLKMYHT